MSLVSNIKWNSFSQVFKILIQVLNLLYLAKLIAPSEYGLMAMASVVVSFGNLLRDLGLSSALIQRAKLTEEIKNTVFWLNLLMGIFICILLCFLSPLLASLYNQPKLVNVFLYISIIFPLSSLASAHLALLERDSKFKAISLIEILTSLLSVTLAIILAKLGYGVFSLVFQAIIFNFISAVLFIYISKWRPSLKVFIKKDVLSNLFSFSFNLSLFNFINYFARNGDSFIIGKFMSASILGAYNLSYRIMLFPLQSLTFVASRSLYPVLSKKQDDNVEIFKVYSNCVFYILFVSAPLMTGVAILSDPFILIFFGPKWFLASDILKVLAPTAILQSILSTTGSVFASKNRTDILVRLGFLGTFLQFTSFLIGVHFSISTFAFCYLIANILNFFPVMWILIKLVEGSFINFFKKLLPLIISTVIMGAALFVIVYNYPDIESFFYLLVISLYGLFIYLLSLFLISKEIRLRILSHFRRFH